MHKTGQQILQLFSIRNQYGKNYTAQKLKLLQSIGKSTVSNKKELQKYYDILLFLIAYPDNATIYRSANEQLQQLALHIQQHERIKRSLFNSGINATSLCCSFSFDIVKWIRYNHPDEIRFDSLAAGDGTIQSVLSVVMPKVESEILQDANSNWKTWMKTSMTKGEELLDRLIAVFNESDLRPEVRDELWAAMGLFVEIDLPRHHCLPETLITPYYHRSLIKSDLKNQPASKPVKININESEAEHIIECGRMILVRHLREIDPVSFTAPRLVSYYRLPRGVSIALMGMVPVRRHPIDSYMGYVVFKNGLPVAYAGSWILFDSGRIGLNVFPSYRGGESQYIFDQVLQLHTKVYQLNRFSVDPYQLGKENSDGIHSGSFWVYHRSGFRPVKEEQQHIAEAETQKKRANKNYRSPGKVLKKLADSRMEKILHKKAVRFDATDLSLAYAAILKTQYKNKRQPAEERSLIRLAKLLQIKNYHEENMQFILQNWCILLISNEQQWIHNSRLKKELKKLFTIKASGAEEDYIAGLQQAGELRKLMMNISAVE